MPVKRIDEYPCKHCGCCSTQRKVDFEYYWVDFGLVLVEKIINYMCKSCGGTFLQIIKHLEKRER